MSDTLDADAPAAAAPAQTDPSPTADAAAPAPADPSPAQPDASAAAPTPAVDAGTPAPADPSPAQPDASATAPAADAAAPATTGDAQATADASAGGSAAAMPQEHLDWASQFCGMQVSQPGTSDNPAPGGSNDAAPGGGVLDSIAGGAKSLWNKAGDVVDQVEDKAKEIGGKIEDGAKDLIDKGGKVVDQVEDKAKEIGGKIEDGAKDLIDKGGKVVDQIEDKAKEIGGKIEDGAKDLIDKGGKILDQVEDKAKEIGGKIEDGAKDLIDKGGKILDQVEDKAKEIGGKIEDKAKGLVDDAKDLFGAGPKAAKAKESAKKIDSMSEADLKKLSFDDKKAMLQDLEGNGTPSGDLRKAQMKLFRNTDLDPTFKNKESDRADKVADQLKDDPDLKASTTDWNTRSDDDKVKALRKVLEAQAKQLGIPVPKIVVDHDPPAKDGSITNGQYGDGVLHLNMDPNSKVGKSLKTAIDTTVHEMSHAYQEDMVNRLKDGKIKPGDPEYNQAQMFALNTDGNYIQPDEDYPTYRKQPEEDHSRTTGPDYSEKIMKKLTVPPPAK